MKKIIKNNITTTDPETHIRLIIYYRKFRTSDLIVKNSPTRPVPISRTNVVYKFKCPIGVCNSKSDAMYIGHTRTTLSRRLTLHLTNTSAISQHLGTHPAQELSTREILVNNTKILNTSPCFKRLEVMEALHIKTDNPALNKINFSGGNNVLKLFNN